MCIENQNCEPDKRFVISTRAAGDRKKKLLLILNKYWIDKDFWSVIKTSSRANIVFSSWVYSVFMFISHTSDDLHTAWNHPFQCLYFSMWYLNGTNNFSVYINTLNAQRSTCWNLIGFGLRNDSEPLDSFNWNWTRILAIIKHSFAQIWQIQIFPFSISIFFLFHNLIENFFFEYRI